MTSIPPIVLSIAGFDPSSGAGVTADIKTVAAHGCYGVTCITALTVQSTAGVQSVAPVPVHLVRDTLQELAADLPPAAVRIGMLGSGEVAEAVAEFLGQLPVGTVSVLDPILRSSSGAELLDAAGVEVLRSRLLGLVTVVTPNTDEAAALTGLTVGSVEQMRAAAAALHELGAKQVVLKGGHVEGEHVVDLLSVGPPSPYQQEFRGQRIESRATHGTGCAFATALACRLALREPLPEAVAAAKAYVAAAMALARPLGRGAGPLNHLYNMEK